MSNHAWRHLTVGQWPGQDDGDEGRLQRGVLIALTNDIRKTPLGFKVPSQSGNGSYMVQGGDDPYCSCPDYARRQGRCKHVYAADFIQHQQSGKDDFNELLRYWQETTGSANLTEGDGAQPVDTDADALDTEAVTPVAPEPTGRAASTGQRIIGSDTALSLGGGSKDGRNWPAYNAAQCNEERWFRILLQDLCSTIDELPQTGRGRKRIRMAEAVFHCALTIYATLSSRRGSTSRLDAFDLGLTECVPSYTTISRALTNPDLTPVLEDLIQLSAMPYSTVDNVFGVDSAIVESGVPGLRELYEETFAVDSTGMSSNVNDAHWHDTKHGSGKRSKNTLWTKLHIIIGLLSHIVTAAKATPGDTGDSLMFQPLLDATARYFNIKDVCADKAYLDRNNIEATHDAGGYLYVPFKVNVGYIYSPDRSARLWNDAFHFFGSNQDAFNEMYHRRSQVETAVWMVKSKFLSYGRRKSEAGRINETLVKVICHNIVTIIHDLYKSGVSPDFLHKYRDEVWRQKVPVLPPLPPYTRRSNNRR